MKKILFPILALVLAVGLALPTAMPAAAHTESEPFITELLAGQDIDVGTVSVWNDGTNLYVTYQITDLDWIITETHLYVGKTDPNDLTTAPGQFPYDDDDATVTDTEVTYVIPLAQIDGYHMQLNSKGKPTGVMVANGEPGVTPCDNVYIAAHAVVQKVTLITAAPYYASSVSDFLQGLRKDGTPVVPARSTPEQGLAFETGQNESNFFSLGFGGWIIVEFDCPIGNGEGDDVQVIEDTWGAYPVEKAEVYASQDGTSWTYLGEADNTVRYLGIHTITDFDLGTLDWARYIKIVDTTDPGIHNTAADGYDLNAVASLQDCIQIEEETAWADSVAIDFDQPNWAMYFSYHIQGEVEERYPETGDVYLGYEDWGNGDFDYNDFGMYFSAVETYVWIGGGLYLTEVSMTFTAQIYDSGGDHLIHITRPIVGDRTVTVDRGGGGHYGSETPEGTTSGTGDVDVVLFDTSKYGWPSKHIDETVTVDIVVGDPSSNPKGTPTAPRWDVDPFMANYDPWEVGTSGIINGVAWHIGDEQTVTGVTGSKPWVLDSRLVGLTLPYILVVPSDAWIPPWEDSSISGPRATTNDWGPYGYFYDYYSTSGALHATWYNEITDSYVGIGGLSW